MKTKSQTIPSSAFEIVSKQVVALKTKDYETMKSLHAKDFIVDWVTSNAKEQGR